MVNEFKKGEAVSVSENFVSTNFDCQCKGPICVTTLIDTDLVDGLEFLWKHVNGLWITSGYRCQAHNKAVGGKIGSIHLVGKAADVQSHDSPDRVSVVAMELIPCFRHGGIGVAKNFVHLDARGYAARWTY